MDHEIKDTLPVSEKTSIFIFTIHVIDLLTKEKNPQVSVSFILLTEMVTLDMNTFAPFQTFLMSKIQTNK